MKLERIEGTEVEEGRGDGGLLFPLSLLPLLDPSVVAELKTLVTGLTTCWFTRSSIAENGLLLRFWVNVVDSWLFPLSKSEEEEGEEEVCWLKTDGGRFSKEDSKKDDWGELELVLVLVVVVMISGLSVVKEEDGDGDDHWKVSVQ